MVPPPRTHVTGNQWNDGIFLVKLYRGKDSSKAVNVATFSPGASFIQFLKSTTTFDGYTEEHTYQCTHSTEYWKLQAFYNITFTWTLRYLALWMLPVPPYVSKKVLIGNVRIYVRIRCVPVGIYIPIRGLSCSSIQPSRQSWKNWISCGFDVASVPISSLSEVSTEEQLTRLSIFRPRRGIFDGWERKSACLPRSCVQLNFILLSY